MTEKIVSTDRIQRTIRLYKGRKVMLDFDLAALYGVTTRHLNRAVRRNAGRFPSDFMYQLDVKDVAALMRQFGSSKKGKGGRRKPVLAFTQEGVAMLSSVLRSERAVQVNIEIIGR